MMPRLSANLGFLWADLALPDAIRAAADELILPGQATMERRDAKRGEEAGRDEDRRGRGGRCTSPAWRRCG